MQVSNLLAFWLSSESSYLVKPPNDKSYDDLKFIFVCYKYILKYNLSWLL